MKEEGSQHLVVEFAAPHNPHVTKMEHKSFNQAVNQLDHDVYITPDGKDLMDVLHRLNKAVLQHLHVLGAKMLAHHANIETPPLPNRVDSILDEINDAFIYGRHAPHTISPVAAPRAAHVQLFYNTQLRALAAFWKCVQAVVNNLTASAPENKFKQYRLYVARCQEAIGHKARDALRPLPPRAIESLPRDFQVVKLLNYVAHVRELMDGLPKF